MKRSKPLFFPGGIGTRMVLAISLVGALIAAVFVAMYRFGDTDITKVLVGALIGQVATAVLYYYKGREEKYENEARPTPDDTE
jgi:hypothetical protein